MTWANRSWSLIFGEIPERFTHIAHFWWATWAICSHRSLNKREWANRSFFKIKNIYKTYKKINFFNKFFLSKLLIRALIMSNLRELLTVTHLSWTTWAICSLLLICLERPEDSLTVAYLSWAIWANRLSEMSKWANEQWANSQPWLWDEPGRCFFSRALLLKLQAKFKTVDVILLSL